MATPSVTGPPHHRKKLASAGLLIFLRSFQLIWTLFALLCIFGVLPADVLTRVVFALGLVLLSIFFHGCAYGYADESGITFRRYLKQYFVPWDQIREAHWGGRYLLNLLVVTERPVGGSRRTYFPYQTQSPVRLWRVFRREWAPDAVDWVLEHTKGTK
jgi:hypothetical protein